MFGTARIVYTDDMFLVFVTSVHVDVKTNLHV